MVVFPTLEQTSLADRVVEIVRGTIERDGLRPGDSLPGEEALAKQLSVSRNVIREALGRLRMLGIVQTRKKRGMVVAAPQLFAGMEAGLIPRLIAPDDIAELMQMRIMLELGMAEYLCARVTDADLADLYAICTEEARHDFDAPERIAQDVAFHVGLYRITGNRSVEQFQTLLIRFFHEARKTPRPRAPGTPWHGDIADALATRNPDTVRGMLRGHLGVHLDTIQP